ncbi:MAG: TlpA disulfide reductase family protein [Thiohalomonadales bacterium]
MKNSSPIIFSILITFTLLFFSSTASAVKVKQIAPDFTLASNKGSNIRLKDLRGKVVMINFWATWCAPCRKELPLLNVLYNKYKSKGFVLLGVNIDDNSKLANKMIKDLKINFPVLFDKTQATSEKYDLQAMPSTFILDKNGVIRFSHYGYKSGYEKKYDKDVKSLL